MHKYKSYINGDVYISCVSEIDHFLTKTDIFAFFSTHRAKSSFFFKITSHHDDSFDILQLVRRMFKIFLLTSRATLRQPFRYPQYILWSHRKFFREIWSDWSPVLHQKSNFLAHTSISKNTFNFAFFRMFFTFRAIYFDWFVLNTFTFHCR